MGKTTFCLLRDRAGQLWAGGQRGLFQLDLAHLTRTRYREGDPTWPLHRCEIEAMSEGAKGELWLVTNQGLYCLQPTTGALRHYGPDEPRLTACPPACCVACWPRTPTACGWARLIQGCCYSTPGGACSGSSRWAMGCPAKQ